MITTAPPTPPEQDELRALIEEARQRARRRRRRNWQITGLVAAIVIAGLAAIAVLTDSPVHAGVATGGPGVGGPLPTGRLTTLRLAGPLAVAPDGRLYAADVARNEVLVRLSNGRFRVVAGDGKTGFSGDGGLAVSARLSDISDLAFAPDGSLYIADSGRVREVTLNGVIHTIAGSGQSGPDRVIESGTPALAAALGSMRSIKSSGDPLSIAVAPTGRLYISTGTQILELRAGRLDVVPARIPTGPWKGNLNGRRDDFGPIAVDARGDVDVAGVNGWAIWQVDHGVAHQVGTKALWLARRTGGDYSILERAPGGMVYGDSGGGLLRIDHRRLIVSLEFAQPIAHEYFSPAYFAFAPSGTIYADELPGGTGFEARQQLLEITNHPWKLLWEQPAQGHASGQ